MCNSITFTNDIDKLYIINYIHIYVRCCRYNLIVIYNLPFEGLMRHQKVVILFRSYRFHTFLMLTYNIFMFTRQMNMLTWNLFLLTCNIVMLTRTDIYQQVGCRQRHKQFAFQFVFNACQHNELLVNIFISHVNQPKLHVNINCRSE